MSIPEQPLEPKVDWRFEASLEEQEGLFWEGRHDALRDVARKGLDFALDLVQDQDSENPYVEGYLAGIEKARKEAKAC